MCFRAGAFLILAFAAAGFAGCGSISTSVPSAMQAAKADSGSPSSPSPIAHVVVVIQENRTFNNFFATYPGADGTTVGKIAKDARCGIHKNGTIALTESDLVMPHDLGHSYGAYSIARAGGKMNGFDKVPFQSGQPECAYPYQYTDPSQIAPYWDIAQQYVLAEHMFTTQGSSSFTAHQDLIAGGTTVTSSPPKAMVDLPSCSGTNCVWGCDAPAKTKTSLISQNDQYYRNKGPFPCLTYATLRDLLDAKSITWKYYVPQMCCTAYGKLLSAFDAIKAVRDGPEWSTNISSPQTNIFGDISSGQLANVSWVIPDESDSDHPGDSVDTGPSWVASIVNAVGESPYWNSTAIVIVWDDWGGLYDNVKPQQVGFGGLGFRVPGLIVSAYAKQGYISQTPYEFGSILKYIEKNWNLGSLGTSDQRANSIIDAFDYSQSPRQFTQIPSSHSKSYFLHRKPSYLPPDTDF
ncbi:MAG: alkaline phosphatase family protein [Candidatus Baltobacteraceae bacterium]